MSERLPRWALFAFVVALPFHNLVMAELWDAGVRDFALDVVSAWKEVLLAAALAVIVWRHRGVPFKATATDWLALAYAALVVLYALIPQDWLGGDASARGILYGVRHDLTPVACYFLGRGLTLSTRDRRVAGALILGVAAVVAAWGLIDIYAISLQTWRESGVPGWFREQLGLEYRGLSYLPENWVYNPGDERPLRRLVSTFLSPLATAYLLLVAILVAATWRRGPRWLPLLTVLAAIALLFTYSRTTIAALAVGLVALGYALRSWWPVAAAAVFVAAAFFFVRAYPDIAPETRYTAAELEIQREGGQEQPTSGRPLRSRGVVVREPSGRARGRGRDGRPAPAGLRRRQRGRDREADGGGDQGRRVDLHRARRRAGAARHARVHRLERLAAPAPAPARALARRRARRRARAGDPDRRDRRALARIRALDTGRRACVDPSGGPLSGR